LVPRIGVRIPTPEPFDPSRWIVASRSIATTRAGRRWPFHWSIIGRCTDSSRRGRNEIGDREIERRERADAELGGRARRAAVALEHRARRVPGPVHHPRFGLAVRERDRDERRAQIVDAQLAAVAVVLNSSGRSTPAVSSASRSFAARPSGLIAYPPWAPLRSCSRHTRSARTTPGSNRSEPLSRRAAAGRVPRTSRGCDAEAAEREERIDRADRRAGYFTVRCDAASADESAPAAYRSPT
jgi:hypothetical protein